MKLGHDTWNLGLDTWAFGIAVIKQFFEMRGAFCDGKESRNEADGSGTYYF